MQHAAHVLPVVGLDLQHGPAVAPRRLGCLQAAAHVGRREHARHRAVDRPLVLLDLPPQRAELRRRRVEHLAAVVDDLLELLDEVFQVGRRSGDGLLTGDIIKSRSKARGLSERDYMAGNLLGQEVTAEDVAQAFVDLALSRKTTGAVLTVDGGNIAAALR